MPLITLSEVTLHYEQKGEGSDVLWISGGGGTAHSWDYYQINPYFKQFYRNTTLDCRGAGTTTCVKPMPWVLEDFSRDVADLIKAVCKPPVVIIGLSFGGGIVQQVAIDYPELVSAGIAMGTGAWSTGWTWDYQMAEIEWRKAGFSFGRDSVSARMAATHYAAMYYPARVLGDRTLWPKLRDELIEYYSSDTNEDSLVAQWEPCVRFDQREQLPKCLVKLHIVAFDQDVQAVPQDNEEVAALAPNAEYHCFEGMGHCSIYGHTQDILNPFLKGLIDKYV